jgi:hypothetical protein
MLKWSTVQDPLAMILSASLTPVHDLWFVYFSQKENILQEELGSGGVNLREPFVMTSSVRSMAEFESNST